MDKQVQSPGAASGSRDIPFTPGTTIAEHYSVIECLGVGKSTTVYKCIHRNFPDRELVLKVLHGSVASDEVAAARFQKEILASYEVNNPHVIRTYEFVNHGGLIAYTMEYAAHGDLRERLSKKLPFTVDESMMFAGQLLTGLQAIHEAGIVHRDIKPENLFFTDRKTLKIADFGIAHTDSGRKLTQQGEVLGAVDYVSPEYVERGQLDSRSDIYALGLVLYEMLTGKLAFPGKSVMDALMKRLRSDPIPPKDLRRECPDELEQIVMKMLARDPVQRYQTCEEALNDLRRLAPDLMPIDSQSLIAIPSLFEQEPAEEEAVLPPTSPMPARAANGTAKPAVVGGAEDSLYDDCDFEAPGSKRQVVLFAVVAIAALVGAAFLFLSGDLSSSDEKPLTASSLPVEQSTGGADADGGESSPQAAAIPAEELAPPEAALDQAVASDLTATDEKAADHAAPSDERAGSQLAAQPPIQVAPEPVPAPPAAVDMPPSQQLEPEPVQAAADPAPMPSPFGQPAVHNAGLGDGAAPQDRTAGNYQFHIVLEGETISHLSRLYDVDGETLMELNGVVDPRRLPTGMRMKIPRQ